MQTFFGGRVLQSAADILIIMIAGGNHTTIYSEALPYIYQ